MQWLVGNKSDQHAPKIYIKFELKLALWSKQLNRRLGLAVGRKSTVTAERWYILNVGGV